MCICACSRDIERFGRSRKRSASARVGREGGSRSLGAGIGSGEPVEVVGDVGVIAVARPPRWRRIPLGVNDVGVGAEIDEQLGEWEVASCGGSV